MTQTGQMDQNDPNGPNGPNGQKWPKWPKWTKPAKPAQMGQTAQTGQTCPGPAQAWPRAGPEMVRNMTKNCLTLAKKLPKTRQKTA